MFPVKKNGGGYGAINGTSHRPQNLIYSWENIDIFGEAPQESNPCLSTFRSCLPCNRPPVQRKHLLKNVHGFAKGGEVLAILGSSGAGKTTLLNVLAYRSPTGIQVSSNAVRAINGIPVTATELRSRCAYVQQDDLFIGTLTPREHLIFQAMLRIPKNVPYKQKLDRVNEVISEVCRAMFVGGLQSLISIFTAFPVITGQVPKHNYWSTRTNEGIIGWREETLIVRIGGAY